MVALISSCGFLVKLSEYRIYIMPLFGLTFIIMYRVCSVSCRVLSTVGDILCTMEDILCTVGNILCTMGGYLAYRGNVLCTMGYLVYCVGISCSLWGIS